jgi:hypothetical protein
LLLVLASDLRFLQHSFEFIFCGGDWLADGICSSIGYCIEILSLLVLLYLKLL